LQILSYITGQREYYLFKVTSTFSRETTFAILYSRGEMENSYHKGQTFLRGIACINTCNLCKTLNANLYWFSTPLFWLCFTSQSHFVRSLVFLYGYILLISTDIYFFTLVRGLLKSQMLSGSRIFLSLQTEVLILAKMLSGSKYVVLSRLILSPLKSYQGPFTWIIL
jgi:hypothetical protein